MKGNARQILKISLLYNGRARCSVPMERLRRELERAGHELVRIVERDSDLPALAEPPAELVVAAGGDGTVRRAASALTRGAIPLAIVPLGTANNVARCLGVGGSLARMARRWNGATRLPLDLGVAACGPEQRWFVEGAGTGLVAQGIVAPAAQALPDERDVRETLARALRAFRQILRDLKPRSVMLRIDGTEVYGEFLLVEVLNIACVGPNLVLSPDADCSDGCFDLVTAGEEHRRDLDEYLRQRIAGKEGTLPLPVRRARNIELHGVDELHVDDSPLAPASSGMSVRVDAAAVQVLA